MITTEETARHKIRQFCQISGYNLSTLSKALEWNTNTLYRFMNCKGSMTLRTYAKVEIFINDYMTNEYAKAEKVQNV